jgi:hypothetical protein
MKEAGKSYRIYTHWILLKKHYSEIFSTMEKPKESYVKEKESDIKQDKQYGFINRF